MFTDNNLYDSNILIQLEAYSEHLNDFLRTVDRKLDDDVHIVFDLQAQEDPQVEDGKARQRYDCNYYLVKHTTRTVFWLDDYDAREFPMWDEVLGVESASQVRKSFPFSCPPCDVNFNLVMIYRPFTRSFVLVCVRSGVNVAFIPNSFAQASLLDVSNKSTLGQSCLR